MAPPSGSGGTVEQVNAWGSYESTANKQARKLHHRHHHIHHGSQKQQQQNQDLRRRGERRNSSTAIHHSFHGTTAGNFYDLEIRSTTDRRTGGIDGPGGVRWKKKDQKDHHRLYSSHRNLLNVSRHGTAGISRNIPVSVSLHGVGGHAGAEGRSRASGGRVVSSTDPADHAGPESGSSQVSRSRCIIPASSSSRIPPSSSSPVPEPGFFETIVTEKRRLSSSTFQPPKEEDPDTSSATKIAETDEVDKTVTERYDDDTARQIDQDDTEELNDEDLIADVRETFPIFFEDPICSSVKNTDSSNNLNCLKLIWSLFMSINATMPWQYDSYSNSKTIKFVGMSLRGIGQVYFMNNPVSGLLILAALFIQSTRVAVHGIIALVAGTVMALLLRFDIGLARSGLFGYNSVLVGLAIATFDSTTHDLHKGYNAATIICTIVFASSSSVIFVMLGKLLAPYKVRHRRCSASS